MKIFSEKVVRVVTDRICDVCNESVLVEVTGNKYEECGELHAKWGYGAKDLDGDSYHLDLCQSCFKVALLALSDHRRSTLMFDKQHDSFDQHFGLDSSNSISSSELDEDSELVKIVVQRENQPEIKVDVEYL